jgi:hypothetical protein
MPDASAGNSIAHYLRAGTGGSLTAIFAPQEHHNATSMGLTSGSSRPGRHSWFSDRKASRAV